MPDMRCFAIGGMKNQNSRMERLLDGTAKRESTHALVHNTHSLSTVFWPTSPMRNSLPLSPHLDSRVESASLKVF